MAEVLIHQFDVCRNPSRATRNAFPFLLVLQHDRAAESHSVIVAPLVPPLVAKSSSRLYPELDVRSRKLMLLTPDLASMLRAALSKPVVNVSEQRDRIIAALDELFTGA